MENFDENTENDNGGGASLTTSFADGSSSATDVSLREYMEAMRHADRRFDNERDRRYKEVNIEREKALKIKETADLAALGLAREIQTYKDEKANELREQINSERGLYATKDDVVSAVEKIEATVQPLNEYVTAERGKAKGIGMTASILVTVITIIISVIVAASVLISLRGK